MKQYAIGDYNSSEFGLLVLDLNVKIEVKRISHSIYSHTVDVIIDGTEYKSENDVGYLKHTPFEFTHEPLGWYIKLGYKEEAWDKEYYTLEINGVRYEEMQEAPARERAELARTAIDF